MHHIIAAIVGFVGGYFLAMALRYIGIVPSPNWAPLYATATRTTHNVLSSVLSTLLLIVAHIRYSVEPRSTVSAPRRPVRRILLQEVDARRRQPAISNLARVCLAPGYWLPRVEAPIPTSGRYVTPTESLSTMFTSASNWGFVVSHIPVSALLVVVLVTTTSLVIWLRLFRRSSPPQSRSEPAMIQDLATPSNSLQAPDSIVSDRAASPPSGVIYRFTYPTPTGPAVRLPSPSPPPSPAAMPVNWPPIQAPNPRSPAAWRMLPPRSASAPPLIPLSGLPELPPILAPSIASTTGLEATNRNGQIPSTADWGLPSSTDTISDILPASVSSEDVLPPMAPSAGCGQPSVSGSGGAQYVGGSSSVGVGPGSGNGPRSFMPPPTASLATPEPSPSVTYDSPTPPSFAPLSENSTFTLSVPPYPSAPQAPESIQYMQDYDHGNRNGGRGRGGRGRGREAPGDYGVQGGRGGPVGRGAFGNWVNSTAGRGAGRGLPDASGRGRGYEAWRQSRSWRQR